jgi:hypothetical protein
MALYPLFLFQFHFLIRKEKGKRNPYFSFKNPLFSINFLLFLFFEKGKKKKISSSFPIPFPKRGKKKRKGNGEKGKGEGRVRG